MATVRPPALRCHTSFAAGVLVRTVSGRLGHANAATTLGVYAHYVKESDREAAAMPGALIAPHEGHGT